MSETEKKTSTKRSYVQEDVRLAESTRLKALWDAAGRNTKYALTQKQFAEKFGLGGQAFVQQLLNGHRPLNLETALPFVSYLRCRLGDFSPRLESLLQKYTAVVMGDPQYDDIIVRLTPALADMIRQYVFLAPHDQAEIAKTIQARHQSMVAAVQRMAPHKIEQMTRMIEPNSLVEVP